MTDSIDKIVSGADGQIRLHLKSRHRKTGKIHNTVLRTDWELPNRVQAERLRKVCSDLCESVGCRLLSIYVISDEVTHIIQNGEPFRACLSCPNPTPECEAKCKNLKKEANGSSRIK